MKPFNTKSPEEEGLSMAEPQGSEAEDVFDPATGSSATAGPSNQNVAADRPVEEDLPKTGGA